MAQVDQRWLWTGFVNTAGLGVREGPVLAHGVVLVVQTHSCPPLESANFLYSVDPWGLERVAPRSCQYSRSAYSLDPGNFACTAPRTRTPGIVRAGVRHRREGALVMALVVAAVLAGEGGHGSGLGVLLCSCLPSPRRGIALPFLALGSSCYVGIAAVEALRAGHRGCESRGCRREC